MLRFFIVSNLLWLGLMSTASVVQADELRDPMRPPALALSKYRQAKNTKPAQPVVSIAAQKPLQLTSILYSANRKIAIIDDQMLVVGDSIRGARLIGITRDSARLLHQGKVINLSLNIDLTDIKKKAVESNL